MNTDERGYNDSLTERVLGAVLEISNTLGAGFLEDECITQTLAFLKEQKIENILALIPAV